MAQRDQRYPQDDYRDQSRGQMDQYADTHRQQGGQSYGGRGDYQQGGPQNDRYDYSARSNHNQSDLRHADPAQASYGRFGAPDVHNAPSGGYRRDDRADAGYNHPGYTQGYGSDGDQRGHWQRDQGDQAYAQGGYRSEGYGHDEGRRGGWDRQSGYGYGGYNQQDLGRFQGASGGYASNRGAYAGTRRYGEQGDQLGYGSGQGTGASGSRSQGYHDPDYAQWRDQQLRSLDEDYHSWRGERYKKFSDEFSEWRKGRPAQGDSQRNDATDDNAKRNASSSGTSATSVGTGSSTGNTGTSGSK